LKVEIPGNSCGNLKTAGFPGIPVRDFWWPWCRVCRAVLFDKLDTSNVLNISSRVVFRSDEPSGIWAILCRVFANVHDAVLLWYGGVASTTTYVDGV